MHDVVVRTHALGRRFGPAQVVEDLNLEVPAGSVYGFLGPNGAGKTTTIRMLLGLLRPSSGSFEILGEAGSVTAVRRRIGALVEAPSLYPHLTGRENLLHTTMLKGLDGRDIGRALAVVGMERDAGRLVKTYSLGMQQRLGLAQALVGNPELVILDEPTNGLDPAGIQEMRHLLRDLPASHGITVFLSSHLLAEVEQMASLVGIIAGGRLQFQGSPAELRSRRGGRLRIGLDRAGVAAQLLAGQGYAAQLADDGALLLPSGGAEATAVVNRLLVERGFQVHSLVTLEPSLEELFLDITQIQ